MTRRLTLLCLALAALTLAAAPAAPAKQASAAAKAKKKKAKLPAITRVTPMRLRVGSIVTIRGRNFSARRTRNTVIFKAPSGRSAFAKPIRATRRKLVVRVPAAAGRLLGQKTTRFRLRVLAGKFGPYTRKRLSPVVVPSNVAAGVPGGPKPLAPGTPGTPGVPGPCPEDGDLLPASLEVQIKTDPCLRDTDGDGVEDGFEYRSAVDLNNDEYQAPNQSLPYPGKRPYPNPLDPSDGKVDYDGDSLSQTVEQRLWKFSTTPATRTLSPLTYSDGLQHSIYQHLPGQGDRRYPALAAAGYSKDTDFVGWASAAGYRNVFVDVHHTDKPAGVYGLFDIDLNGSESNPERYQLDRNGDGWLSDAERDEDADGLSNTDENTRRAQRSWWNSCYREAPYYLAYAGTAPDDADSDGDGVRDGADDQDHDDVPNIMELSRMAASSGLNDTEPSKGECVLSKTLAEFFGNQDPPIYHHSDSYGRVNPFNPCLPDRAARTCNSTVSFETPWAPFDDSVDWVSLN